MSYTGAEQNFCREKTRSYGNISPQLVNNVPTTLHVGTLTYIRDCRTHAHGCVSVVCYRIVARSAFFAQLGDPMESKKLKTNGVGEHLFKECIHLAQGDQDTVVLDF